MMQKAFMIPQELGELIVSSAAIFAITRPTQKLASNLVKTGKILPKELVLYMKEKDLKNSYSKVCGVAYDINDIKRIIAFCRKHNFKWYYIRHNDYDENMEEKKKHYHFIIEGDSSHRFNIKSLLTDTFKCNLINKLDNVAYYLRYMIHIDYALYNTI